MATFTFTSTNNAPLTITTGTVASSTITTYGLAEFSVVYTVSLTLNDLNHTYADDLDMQLVSPTFRDLVFWSDAGTTNDLQGDYTIIDSATNILPDAAPINAGSYRPMNYGADETAADFGSFAGPTHATGAIGEFLNRFNGGAAEGNWSLFIRDDAGGDNGTLGSWSLTITTLSDRVYLDGTAEGDTILALLSPLGTGAYQMNDLPAVTITGIETFDIDAKGGDDVIYGSAGTDFIQGGTGRDTIRAGGGSDRMRVESGENVAGEIYDGGLGVDEIDLVGSTANFQDDTVLSIEKLDLGAATAIFNAAQIGPGLAANATITGTTDFVDPETQEVFQYADVLEVRLTTTTSVSLTNLIFVNFNDPLDRIRIVGDGTAEDITGTGLADVIDGGGNADTMRGLAGNDTYYVNVAGDGVVEAVGNGTDTVLASAAFTLGATQEIEILMAANAAATNAMNLNGNEFANEITGNAGVNVLNGGGADDALYALGGADVLVGGAGFDSMSGGAAADRFNFDSIADIGMGANARDVILDFEVGIDKLDFDDIDALTTLGGTQHFTWMGTAAHSGAGATLRYQQVGDVTLLYGDVNANGSADFTLEFSDLLNLTAADFTIASITAIQGSNGADTLTGAPGGKTMSGLDGNDTITGGTGADTIIGGAGADTLNGLGGPDVFRYSTPSHTGLTNATRDVIAGFQQGLDKIDLAAIDANTGVAGNQAFAFIGTAAHTAGGGSLRFSQSGGNTFVFGDVGGAAGSDFSIQLNGLFTLTVADFVL